MKRGGQLALAAALALAGCGQKGALYLPDGKNKKGNVPATTPANPPPAPAAPTSPAPADATSAPAR